MPYSMREGPESAWELLNLGLMVPVREMAVLLVALQPGSAEVPSDLRTPYFSNPTLAVATLISQGNFLHFLAVPFHLI